MAEIAEVSASSAARFLTLLARVSEMLRDLTERLRQSPHVRSVERRSDIEDGGDRPAVEWYVDAELVSGEAVSFRLLLFWLEAEWIVESDVRRIHAAGSDLEIELATRYVMDDDLEKELLSAASQLGGSMSSLRLHE